MKRKIERLACLAFFSIIACAAFADTPSTGWKPVASGPWIFGDSENWDGGDINGVFPSSWTPTEAQTIYLTEDWTGSLSFLGTIAKNLTFAGRNADNNKWETRTITLSGDLAVQPSGSSSAQIVFNQYTAIDLGGEERRFLCYSPSNADRLRITGPVRNGNLVLGGDGAGMTLVGNAAVEGDVTVLPNTTLAVNWATSTEAVRRMNDLELHRATFSVSAYLRNNTFDLGALRVSGEDAAGVSLLTIADNNFVATVRPDVLDIVGGGTLAVMAANLGVATDATVATRLLFNEAPVLAGDAGDAGTPGVAVLPGVVIGTAYNALPTGTINKSEDYNGLFLATYDAERGVRPLSDDETATEVSATEAVNLVVNAGAPLALQGDAEVNSLQLRAANYRNDVPEISGDGTLCVKSGMVLMTVPKSGANLNVAVDFGSVQGRFIAVGPHGEQAKVMKSVRGTGGVVFSKGMATSFDTTAVASSSTRGFAISSSADYTGDTYVQCMVEIGSNDFIPHGARSGDTIVNGCLSFGTIALNGLYGTGAVRGATLNVGEDGSDSDFDGKAYLTSALNVKGGTFKLIGCVENGIVNVENGAGFCGSGEVKTQLVFNQGSSFEAQVVDGACGPLVVEGEVSGDVTVNATVGGTKWSQEVCVLKSNTENGLAATFRKGNGVGRLELKNNNTELWAAPRISGLTLIFR